MRRRPDISSILMIVLLGACALRLATGGWLLWWQGVTIDEPDFLFGGLLAWTQRGFWVDVDNPPLLKMIVTLPSLLAGLDIPTRAAFPYEFARADHYALGKALMFELNPAGKTSILLYTARALNLAIVAALAGLWAREIFRRHRAPRIAWPGVIAVLLMLIDPALLSLASLFVLDTAAVFASATALLFTLRWASEIERRSIVPVALLWAAAITIKFTSLILLVIAVILLFLRLAGAILLDKIQWTTAPHLVRLCTRRMMLGALIFGLAVWAIYGFEWGRMMDRLEPYHKRRGESIHEKIATMPPASQSALMPLRVPVPMPSFFTGVGRIFRAGGIEKKSWLLGQIHERGSRLYYPAVFALKTPLITLALAALGAAALMRRWGRARGKRRLAHGPATERLWPLAVAVLFIIVVFPRTNNMGYRYLLPLLPFLYMLAAEGVAWCMNWPSARRRAASVLFALILALDLACLAAVWPNPLAFVNAAGGGPDRAWYIATDSNVDWGQEVRRLNGLTKRLRAMAGDDAELAGLVYTPGALPYYGIDLPLLDAAAWQRVRDRWMNSGGEDNPHLFLIWSATKATGFSPAPGDSQSLLLQTMRQGGIRPAREFTMNAPPGQVYQEGQSYFFLRIH